MVGVRLGHAGGDRADTDLGDQFDADAGVGVHVLQVVDQLFEILDRVDVVVWRRRDEPDAGRREAHPGDPLVHLVAGQLTTLARLGALRHLDLDVIGVDQVLGGHAEPAGRNLLDGGPGRIAVLIGHVPARLLTALPGVGLGADPVHGDRQVGVRLPGDRPERHGARGEPLDDLGRRFDLFDGNRA